MPSSPYTPQLRPLSIGEILDAGFRLFRSRFGALMTCVLVPIVPLTILGTFLVASADENAFDVNAPATDDGGAVTANLIDALISGAAAALAIAACFKVISAAYLGERSDAGSSLRYGLTRFPALMVAYVAIYIGLVFGFLLLVIPGIIFAVKWSLTFAAIVAERAGPFAAMGRSWSLTGDHWWRTFGTLLVVILLSVVLTTVLFIALGAALATSDSISELTFAVLVTLVSIVVTAVVYPLVSAIITVLYYDLRVRKEGFDLQLLARSVGADSSQFQSAPEAPGPATGGSVPSPGGGFAPPQGSSYEP
jgi:glycerophosphoryl diester phosphodiesterase family protein